MNVCIFCGSSPGNKPAYAAAATRMGQCLVQCGHSLVYGGGRVGLMGTVADAVMAAGGSVTGIIPQFLVDREVAHTGLTELIVVTSMHDRKTRMAGLADAFVALPGGAGTLEEMFEQWTWAQLGFHQKPCAFLNVEGYFDPLRRMIDDIVANDFIQAGYAEMLIFETDPQALLSACEVYKPPTTPKWVEPSLQPTSS